MAVATAAVVAFALAARAEPDAPQDGKLGARIGGKCTYVEHPGTCTVVSIEKTHGLDRAGFARWWPGLRRPDGDVHFCRCRRGR